jgi:homoserine dehydrogenase
MEAEGLSFEACLKDAQRLGYAEADPTFDIEGNDTAHKLSILTSLAFGTKIAADDIYLEGISNISQADIRAAPNSATASSCWASPSAPTPASSSACTRPWCRPPRSSRRCMASPMRWRSNRHFGRTAAVGPRRRRQCHGVGRHRRHCRHRQEPPRFPARAGVRLAGEGTETLQEGAHAQSHAGGYFIRLTVHDRTGVFAGVAKRMADADISLESIVQRSAGDERPNEKTVILVTHETTEAAVRKAVDGITKDGLLTDKPQVIRIERAE